MTNDVIYRLMQPEDERPTFELVKRGFDEFVRRDCREEGIEEFLRASHAMVFSRPSGHFLMVAESGRHIVGMIDIKDDGHICLLFVNSRSHGRGIGRELVERATASCRSRKPDLSKIDVNSSLWAVPVYARLGFKQIEPEQERNGIRFVRMVKEIEPESGSTGGRNMEMSAKQIFKRKVVKGHVDEIWRKWTTHEGLKTFFGRDNRIELKIGGAFEIYFLLNNPEGLRGSEGCKVLSYLPNRMLSFSWNVPAKFKELRDSGYKTWVVVIFSEIGENGTEIALTHLGWPEETEWDPVFDYFVDAWDHVLSGIE